MATWALTGPWPEARAQTIAESEVTSPAVTPLVNPVAAAEAGTRSATAIATAAIPPNWHRLPTTAESSRNAPVEVRAPTWFWCRRARRR